MVVYLIYKIQFAFVHLNYKIVLILLAHNLIDPCKIVPLWPSLIPSVWVVTTPNRKEDEKQSFNYTQSQPNKRTNDDRRSLSHHIILLNQSSVRSLVPYHRPGSKRTTTTSLQSVRHSYSMAINARIVSSTCRYMRRGCTCSCYRR